MADRDSAISKFKLPVYKNIVERFEKALQHRIFARARSTGLISQIKPHVIHEGRESTIVYAAGDQSEINMREHGVETKMTFDELEHINLSYVLKKIDEIGGEFAKSHSKSLFELMDEVTTQTGNILDARNKPLSNEAMMDALEMMPHEFDENGNLQTSMVVSPMLAERLLELEQELRARPDLQKRLKEILERKKDEFRTREMDRNLVG